MRIQHNTTALNAHRQLGGNNNMVSKNLEKLSSGFRINRAGDDAAGLAISEKMRAQIRGLETAQKNANDGISLIQTAEGALTEVHSMLNRMVELATQSSNGTYTDKDRQKLQDEVKSLGEEIDRISQGTNFNGINLLDGSLGGAGGSASGPRFGVQVAAGGALGNAILTSDRASVSVALATGASVGNESAIWSSDGNSLTINLATGKTYTQSDMDKLIANAKQNPSGATADPAKISLKLAGSFVASAATTGSTVMGVKASSPATAIAVGSTGAELTFEMNVYGAEYNNAKININFTAHNESSVTAYMDNPTAGSLGYTVSLQAGKEYTTTDIQNLLQDAGLNITVRTPDESKKIYSNTATAVAAATLASGAGVSKLDPNDVSGASGGGLTLQVGDTSEDFQKVSVSVANMSAGGLGISGISVASLDSASKAIDKINNAIDKVSTSRGGLGALQNRLEHTVSNLGVTTENLVAAESRIRDVDMADEMMEFTKNNILTQAAQAMLAQANQLPQGVLQLLR